MNKKYLSVILFGALMLGTTGTFTSCKDYDDDINNLQDQINTVVKDLNDLKSQIENLGTGVSSVTFDESTGVLTVVDGNGTHTYTIKTSAPEVDEVVITIEGQDLKVNGETVGKVGDTVAVENGELTINGEATGIKVGEYAILDNQDNGTVTITLPDADGNLQTVQLMKAGAILSYINVINAGGISNKSVKLEALYDINDADVTYSPYDRTLKAGLYTTLDRDLKIVVNPQSADASIYKFALKNSEGQDTELEFNKAQAYQGALTAAEVTSRASSESGIWVLENKYTRYDNNNLTDIRTNLYKRFANEAGNAYALTLQASNGVTTFNTPYDLSAEFRKIKNPDFDVLDMQYTLQGVPTKPVLSINTGDESAIYDYWLTIEQSATNLQKAELYQVKISEDGYTFSFNRETAVGNDIYLVYNYILVDGTVFQGQTPGTNQGKVFNVEFAEEMANVTDWPFEDKIKPFDATYVDGTNYKLIGSVCGAATAADAFGMTETYNFAEYYSALSAGNKLVWDAAMENRATAISFKLIGGEGNDQAENLNAALLKNIRYAIDNDEKEIDLQFLVDADVANNFKLNTAYELVMTVKDPIANNTVAVLTFPFELQQPTLDIIHTNDKWTVWTTDKNGYETLTSYGAYGDATTDPNNAVKMYLPMYEAFQAWTTEHTVYDKNAKYYILSQAETDVTLLGKGANTDAYLDDDLKYGTSWSAWNTYADDATVTYNTNGDEVEKTIPVKAEFKHYGVYDEPKVKDFDLTFASLLNHSTLKMADGKETLVVNTGTHDVFISNDILNLTIPEECGGGKFFFFDGINADGSQVVARKTLNEASFNEEQRGFMTVDEIFDIANFKAKAKTGSTTYGFINANNAGWSIDPQTGKLSYTVDTPDANNIKIYQVDAAAKRAATGSEVLDSSTTMVGAHTGGIVIQLPTCVADQEEVEITLTVEDGLGFTNDLKFVVKKIQ